MERQSKARANEMLTFILLYVSLDIPSFLAFYRYKKIAIFPVDKKLPHH